jgi:hypothetical protein
MKIRSSITKYYNDIPGQRLFENWSGNPTSSELVCNYMNSLKKTNTRAHKIPRVAKAITQEEMAELYKICQTTGKGIKRCRWVYVILVYFCKRITNIHISIFILYLF